jgi:hypothetical protein
MSQAAAGTAAETAHGTTRKGQRPPHRLLLHLLRRLHQPAAAAVHPVPLPGRHPARSSSGARHLLQHLQQLLCGFFEVLDDILM